MANNRMPEFSAKHVERFWSRVKKSESCWDWTAATDSKGYGKIGVWIDKKSVFLIAHRVAYYLSTGIDPGELLVLHRCDRPPCCNPDHHFLGDGKDNTADMVQKGRGRKPSPDRGLFDNDVYMMREMWISRQFSQAKIADAYKLERPYACIIISGKRWKHVPMPPGDTPPHGWRFDRSGL